MYDEIFELIQNGELNKAQEQLENTPENDPKRYNISGLIYYQKKEFDKAKEEFEKGLKINPVDSDLLFNYGYLLKNIDQEKEAWRYLMRIHNKDWATYDLLGDIEYKNRSKLSSLRFYKKAAELPNSPNEMKKKFIDMRNIVKQDTKIAFLCLPGLDNFLKDIVETFSLGYDVKLVVTTDGNQISEAIKWADIVWLEWTNEMAVFATNQIPEIQNKKVVCRLHSYEAFTQFPDKINWTNIDQLIFVGDHIKRILHELHPNLNINPDKEIIVSNGVDLDKFKFLVHKPGYNLSVLAHINYKKDPSAWIQIINKLKEIDNRYKLHVGGDFQDPRYKIYFDYIKKEMNLENNFILHGWINEVDKFLEDKDYTLSTSIHEGHPYNILESMARGIKPVILNYSGAKEQWPNELIYNTIDEAVEKITELTYDSESYRRFIEDNYSLERQINKIEITLKNSNFKKFSNSNIQSKPKEITSGMQLKRNLINISNFSSSSIPKYLHIIIDSNYIEKFCLFIKEHFDVDEHLFVSFSPNLQYVEYNNIYYINKDNQRDIELLNHLAARSDKIFLHSLFDLRALLWLLSNQKYFKKTCWKIWGGDLYYYKFRNKDLKFDQYEEIRKHIIQNISYIITFMNGDYALAQKWYKTIAKCLPAFYPNPINYQILDLLEETKEQSEEKITILIGNSADPSNKQLEIFEKLLKFKNENIEIITPLSYGNTEWAKYVVQKGKELYGDKFKPLLKFLPPEEYAQVLNSVDIAIFNHDRQQALGNILALLYLRKKVYIKNDITTWDFFNEKNIKVYNTYKITNSSFREFLSFEDNFKNRNKEIVQKEFSEEKCIELWKNVFNS